MHLSTPLLASAALAATAFLATPVQDERRPPKAPETAGAAKIEMPVAQVGPEHARLAKRVGTWDVTITMGGEARSTSKGVDRSRLLGERWLISDFEADFMGAPFQGHGVMGYDPLAKKYVQTWVDTSTERPIVSEGTYDESGRTLTMRITPGSRDSATGQTAEEKHVSRWIDDDTMVFELYVGGEAHPMVMSVEYKRRK